MNKPLIIAIVAFAGLAGCVYDNERWGVYRIPVQQGNQLTQDMINDLELGMSKEQVLYLLGTPLLIDTFNESRWQYMYTNRPAGRGKGIKTETSHLELYFDDDRLGMMLGDTLPQEEGLASLTKAENQERVIVIPPDAPKPTERYQSPSWKEDAAGRSQSEQQQRNEN